MRGFFFAPKSLKTSNNSLIVFYRPQCYFEPISDGQDTPVEHCNTVIITHNATARLSLYRRDERSRL